MTFGTICSCMAQLKVVFQNMTGVIWVEEYITYKDNRKFSDLKKYFLKFKMLAGTCWNPIIQLTINLYFCPYRRIHHEMKIATTFKL